MARLVKETALHTRDEKGELVPIEVTLELLKTKGEESPSILVIPMSRPAFKKIVNESLNADLETDNDQNLEIVKKYCVEPKFTDEELKVMTLEHSGAIATAIMSITTGQSQQSIEIAGKKVLLERMEQQVKKK